MTKIGLSHELVLELFKTSPQADVKSSASDRLVELLKAHPLAGIKSSNDGRPLDKLAQPRKSCSKTLAKRAQAKAITLSLVNQLLKVRNSPLHESYKRSITCGSVLVQTGKTITTKYCNNRWCLVCNRIRTAKLINGYEKPLKELKDPWFVTLTIPNMSRVKLTGAIDGMITELGRIRETMRKRKIITIGIRKIEVTYNQEKDNYHPHFHLIIEGEEVARQLHDLWLERYPAARAVGQDIREAKTGTEKELFKYFTKLISKSNGKACFLPVAMDVIFRAMAGRRVFQPMGIRKEVAEDVDEIQSVEYSDIDPGDKYWNWSNEANDWVDQLTGELLTGFTPSPVLQEFLDQIRAGPP